MVIFLDTHTHLLFYFNLFYFITRCNIDFPPTVSSDISKARSKTWRYRGIHLHCSLLYLHEGVNACTVVTSHSPRTTTGSGTGTGTGAVIGSSCVPNPLTPTIPKAEQLSNIEKELKMWRAVVVVDIQQPHYIRIRSDDPSCEVSTPHILDCNWNWCWNWFIMNMNT